MNKTRELMLSLPEWVQELIKDLYHEVWSPCSIQEIVEEQAEKRGCDEETALRYCNIAVEIADELYEDQDVETLEKVGRILGYNV